MEKLMQGADPENNTPRAPEELDTSEVYLLRVWREGVDPGKPQWRGRIQNILSPEACFFSSWPAFVQIVTAMMPDTAGARTEPGDPVEPPCEGNAPSG
jgi:hypothetical protein